MVVWMHQDKKEEEATAELPQLPGLLRKPEMGLDDYDDNDKEEDLVILGNRNGPSINEILKSLVESIQQRYCQQINSNENCQNFAEDKLIDIYTEDQKVM